MIEVDSDLSSTATLIGHGPGPLELGLHTGDSSLGQDSETHPFCESLKLTLKLHHLVQVEEKSIGAKEVYLFHSQKLHL